MLALTLQIFSANTLALSLTLKGTWADFTQVTISGISESTTQNVVFERNHDKAAQGNHRSQNTLQHVAESLFSV